MPAWAFFADPKHDEMAGGMSSSTAATDIVIPYREDLSRVEYKYESQTRTYGRWQNSDGKPVRDIDGVNDDLPALKSFVLPGGGWASAYFHLARTVCRRCERIVVALAATEDVGELAVRYLNRLSDALFVWGRWCALKDGQAEPLWDSRST